MHNNIVVIDQTIREGMQHKGIVFSYSQREKIVKFQEKLNIEYPSHSGWFSVDISALKGDITKQ